MWAREGIAYKAIKTVHLNVLNELFKQELWSSVAHKPNLSKGLAELIVEI
jgi:hypothetical protein